MSLSTLARTVLAAALTAVPALADDALANTSRLTVGPLIGGQDIRFELRTLTPNSLALVLYSTDGTPTLVGPAPLALGLNTAAGSLAFVPTDAAGQFVAAIPTLPGEFGPTGAGDALFFQTLHVGLDGRRVLSNVEATELEPLPAIPGFLVEDGASRLPSGFDTVGGNTSDHVDLNRDGYLDVVIASDFDVSIWINDATNPGNFLDETSARITTSGDAISAIEFGDIDCDGDADMLIAGGFDDFISIPDRLYLNDGAGNFTQDVTFPIGVGLTQDMQFADVDQDGDLDIWLGVGAEGHIGIAGKDALYLNFDCGLFFVADPFIDIATWNDDTTTTATIKPFDMDSDGDLDALVVKGDTGGVDGTPGQPNILLENDGFGVFTDISSTNLTNAGGARWSDNSSQATFADIDGDFDLDIIVANSVASVDSSISGDVYINQGGLQGGTEGNFKDDPTSFLEAFTPADYIRLNVQTGDIDSDGDVDIIMNIHELFLGGDQMLFLNSGGAGGGVEGQFTREFWFDPPFSGEFAPIGDFVCGGGSLFDADNDGDLDFLMLANGFIVSALGNSTGARLLINSKL